MPHQISRGGRPSASEAGDIAASLTELEHHDEVGIAERAGEGVKIAEGVSLCEDLLQFRFLADTAYPSALDGHDRAPLSGPALS